MKTTTRPTPEERLDAWLAWEAVRDEVPFEQRLDYMAALRKSSYAQYLLVGFTLREAGSSIADGFRSLVARLP